MITVGHLFELSRSKSKYDTVLTGRVTSFVDDMQIHHAFQQESIYHFLKFAPQKNHNLWQVRWSNFHLYQK